MLSTITIYFVPMFSLRDESLQTICGIVTFTIHWHIEDSEAIAATALHLNRSTPATASEIGDTSLPRRNLRSRKRQLCELVLPIALASLPMGGHLAFLLAYACGTKPRPFRAAERLACPATVPALRAPNTGALLRRCGVVWVLPRSTPHRFLEY